MRTVTWLLITALIGCKAHEDLDQIAQTAAAPYRDQLVQKEIALEAARKAAVAWHQAVPRLELGDRGVPQFATGTAVLTFADLHGASHAVGLPLEVEYILHPPREFSAWRGDTPEEIQARVTRASKSMLLVRYAVVVRVLQRQEAQLTGWDTFEGGHIFADALVFDLKDNTLMGGYPVVGLNSKTITLHGADAHSDDMAKERLRQNVADDLESEARLRLDDAVQAALAREQVR
jgi:hypothetical protein